MTRLARLTSTTALVTLISGTPALADVTADDVWESMKAVYQSFGITTEATQSRTGNVVGLDNLKFSGIFPFDLGSITITTTGFDLVENGNGTVAIEMPDNMPLAIALTLPDDLFVTATLDYRITGYSALVSGDPGNITIKSTMENMTLELTDLGISSVPDFEITASMTMGDMDSTAHISSADMLTISQNVTYGGMAVDGSVTVDNLNGKGMITRFSTTMDEMKSETNMVLPATGIDLMNLPAQLRAGLSFQGTSEIQDVASKQTITVDGKVISDQKTSVESTDDFLSFSQDGVKLDSLYINYTIDYIMPELPVPLRLNFAKAGGTATLPLLKSDKEQNFSYSLLLDGMTMGEELWALFDPTTALPRDPASVTLDLSGKDKLFVDLLDIDAMQKATNGGIKFGELTSLTINNMDMSAVGAKLSGTGTFTFDNSNLETYDGFPAPSGTASFNIAGLNALMDKLDAIGLLPDEARMGIGMGLSLMTVAGDGEDTLISDIEITPDGQITANGKRLK